MRFASGRRARVGGGKESVTKEGLFSDCVQRGELANGKRVSR